MAVLNVVQTSLGNGNPINLKVQVTCISFIDHRRVLWQSEMSYLKVSSVSERKKKKCFKKMRVEHLCYAIISFVACKKKYVYIS